MKDEFVKSIGIWGQRHYDYLRKNKPMVINVMRMNGTLLYELCKEDGRVEILAIKCYNKTIDKRNFSGIL